MNTQKPNLIIRILVVVTYTGMIAVNALANIIPINGITTGEVSELYPNLFTPAPVTFAIWGLIYLLLLGYTLYQLGCFGTAKSSISTEGFNNIGILFGSSCVLNAAWIFAWHYLTIGISVLLMFVLLFCLIFISFILLDIKPNKRDMVLVFIPFHVYFGWITVAAIANVTVFLVKLGWNGFGMSEVFWTVFVLLLGLVVSVLVILRIQSIAYGLAVMWAYAGILVQHLSKNGFAGAYPPVIVTAALCITVLVLVQIVLGIRLLNRSKTKRVRG